MERLVARPRAALGYGLVVALVFAFVMGVLSPVPYTMQGGRVASLQQTKAALDHGAPPLLQLDRGRYLPAGATDDQGGYVLVPVIADIVGTNDMVQIMKWCYVAGFALLVLLAPVLFGRLFGTWEAAVAAPWGMAVLGASVFTGDVYWVGPWAIAGLLPVLFLVDEQKPRRSLLLIAIVMVAASFASSIRSQAGLPVLLTGLAVIALAREWTVGRRAAVALLAIGCYLAITPGVLAGLRDYRDHWVDQPRFAAGVPHGHPFWHNAYIGLGYLPNVWQIRWHDEVSEAAVQRVRPGTQYVSKPYESILRRLWFDALKSRPGFVVGQAVQKGVVVVKHSALYLAFLLLTLPFLVPRLRRPGRERRWALLMLPAFVLPLIQPLLTVPYRNYELQIFGALGLVALLTVAGGARALRLWSNGGRRLDLRAHRLAVASVVAGIVLLGALYVVGGRIESRANDWLAQPAKPAPLP